MKRETLNHPKVDALCTHLDVGKPAALGFLTLLWDCTGEHAPQGNIGRWPDEWIAKRCHWHAEPHIFVAALIETGWLDQDEEHRLLIHDWPHHCEQWVKKKLQRANLTFIFASGQCPDGVLHSQSKPIQSKPIQTTSSAASPELAEVSLVLWCKVRGLVEWRPTLKQVQEWQQAYPAIDVNLQLQQMRVWMDANPRSRKTVEGVSRFVTNWLSRNQNRAPPKRNGKPKGQATFLRLKDGDS